MPSADFTAPINSFPGYGWGLQRAWRAGPAGSSPRKGKRKVNASAKANAKYKASRKASRANRARMAK